MKRVLVITAGILAAAGMYYSPTSSTSAWECTPVPTPYASATRPNEEQRTNTPVPPRKKHRTSTPVASETAVRATQTPIPPSATSAPESTPTTAPTPPVIIPPETGTGGFLRGESGCIDEDGVVHDDD